MYDYGPRDGPTQIWRWLGVDNILLGADPTIEHSDTMDAYDPRHHNSYTLCGTRIPLLRDIYDFALATSLGGASSRQDHRCQRVATANSEGVKKYRGSTEVLPRYLYI